MSKQITRVLCDFARAWLINFSPNIGYTTRFYGTFSAFAKYGNTCPQCPCPVSMNVVVSCAKGLPERSQVPKQ